MTTDSFITIRELSETHEGLRIEHHDGTTSFLRRDNERYGRIEAILRNAKDMSVPWPVLIARSDDGAIVNAWVADGGQVFVVDEEPTGDCTAYFLLLNSPKTLKRTHPEFLRLLETLMHSAGERVAVFYCEVPGEKNVLADVCLAR